MKGFNTDLMSFFKKKIVSSVKYISNNTCGLIISYNFENQIGHWERRIHLLCVWTFQFVIVIL